MYENHCHLENGQNIREIQKASDLTENCLARGWQLLNLMTLPFSPTKTDIKSSWPEHVFIILLADDLKKWQKLNKF